MLGRAGRLITVVAVALQLGGCIYSNYDLSSTLKSEFPIKPGTFAKGDKATIVVRRYGDAYRGYNSSTKLTTFARLYKIPEYPDYLMQYSDRKERLIVNLFLKPTEKGFEVYTIDKLAKVVPTSVETGDAGFKNSTNETKSLSPTANATRSMSCANWRALASR